MRTTVFAVSVASLLAALAASIVPSRADSERIGVWTVTAEPSSSGQGGIVTALSPSPGASLGDPSYLVARCLGGRSEFMVGGAGGWGMSGRKLEVMVEIDGGAAETAAWDVSTNGKAVFLDDKVEDFLKKLPDNGKLRILIKDGSGVDRENIFATTGFGTVREQIAKACLWPK